MRRESSAGRVITFYSYKGGVGRSMLLANVAWVLAFAGKRVLVVDWDLEAPGLEHYFRPWLGGRDEADAFLTRPGVIDQLESYCELAELRLRAVRGLAVDQPEGDSTPSGVPACEDLADEHEDEETEESDAPEPEPPVLGDSADSGDVSLLFDSPQLRARRGVRAALGRMTVRLTLPEDWIGEIHIVPPGRRDDPAAYANRVALFDWDRFYAELEGKIFLGEVKERMRAYDYVLIDSRTGISGTAAVSMIEFADELVTCFGMNDQSIYGVADMVETFLASREGKPARIFPVPMRVDRQRSDRYGPARELYERTFNRWVRKYFSEIGVGKYWTDVEIPYESNYAFEELAGPTSGMDPGADGYAAACKRLARLIDPDAVTRDVLERLDLVMSDLWRTQAKTGRRTMDPAFTTVIVSYVDEEKDRAWALWLTWLAESRGLRVISHLATRESLGVVRDRLEDCTEFCLVPVLSAAYFGSPNAVDFLRWGQNAMTAVHDRCLRPVKIELDVDDTVFTDAFGLDLLDLDSQVAERAVADLLTVPIGQEEAAVAEQFEESMETELETATRRPDFPGDVLPADRYALRLEEARRRADDSGAISNALLLGVEIAKQGRMNGARQLFAEAARLAKRQPDDLTRVEVLVEWGATERRHGNPGIADERLIDAEKLLAELAATAGERAKSPRYRQLIMRIELERLALLRDSTRLEDRRKGHARAEALRLDASDRNDEQILADAITHHAEQLATQGIDEDAWRNFVEARYLHMARGNAAGMLRTELGLGELALKVDGPDQAERYYKDADGQASVLDEDAWQERYTVERRRADAELKAGLIQGNPKVRRNALGRARDHYERALDLVSDHDQTFDSVGAGRPEDRQPLRTRQTNLWFGAATGLANVLDALARLDFPNATELSARATRLRIRAVEQLDWTEVDPRFEHGEALRAGRGTSHLPPRKQLENAALAYYVFDRIKNQLQADAERRWIRGNRGEWRLADMKEFVSKTLDPQYAALLAERLESTFLVERRK